MEYTEGVLRDAAVWHEAFHRTTDTIWLTRANQLISTYDSLTRFAEGDDCYRGWHAHHIVERQDLARIGALANYPIYEKQVCVLLPRSGHEKRLNSILAHHRQFIAHSPSDLLPAYYEAYELIGDYCEGGEDTIKAELISIVKALLARAGRA